MVHIGVTFPDQGPIPVGYWKSDEDPELPDPADHIVEWDPVVRALVLGFLRGSPVYRRPKTYPVCLMCGQDIGSCERSDGVYMWHNSLEHYVEKHDVGLPSDFVEHILRYLNWESP